MKIVALFMALIVWKIACIAGLVAWGVIPVADSFGVDLGFAPVFITIVGLVLVFKDSKIEMKENA